jgi:hypothetical protein
MATKFLFTQESPELLEVKMTDNESNSNETDSRRRTTDTDEVSSHGIEIKAIC